MNDLGALGGQQQFAGGQQSDAGLVVVRLPQRDLNDLDPVRSERVPVDDGDRLAQPERVQDDGLIDLAVGSASPVTPFMHDRKRSALTCFQVLPPSDERRWTLLGSSQVMS